MSVLLIDSDGELWYERQEKLQVDYISMPYTYNGQLFYDDLGKTTDFDAFYNAVRSGVVPKTMALNPEEYKTIIEKYWKQGEDILYVSFSHKMSGTFNQLDYALSQLQEKYPERKCTVFDTKSISLGAGIQMEEAARLKQQGASDEEILAFLNDFTNRVAEYFVVDDLMHLKRGGRLSTVSAYAGTLLGLKPILTLDEHGALTAIEKIAGRKKALKRIADKVIADLTGTQYTVYILDADCKNDGDELARMISEKRPDAKIVRQIIGPVIGTHCGPGCVGVCFIADKRPIQLEK